MATGSVHFNLSSEVLNRTSSHMRGRWYLPMFLFRDGLLTLMYKASMMALMRFCSSLPTMLKFSKETWWTTLQMFWMIHQCIHHHTPPCYIYICRWLHFSFHGILVLGSHQEFFDGCTSFEMHLHSMVTAHLLKTFTEPSVVWNNNVRFLGGVSSRFVLVVTVFTCAVYVAAITASYHQLFTNFTWIWG